ncbi:beta-glucosidase [Novosphingobium sp. PhB165]|uniref:beta-glucosidase n=1 Tax=Novosphingobium sp. PhB165 TaxID=2485105 RepID=UPI0010487CD0|nr:glycoside hydrolase family 3 C-terminal domain-containing protein [Novosphingobium sp. PhB165]TCM20700.1 beta-glucosidase [Novosphingobium sp. PhB165]
MRAKNLRTLSSVLALALACPTGAVAAPARSDDADVKSAEARAENTLRQMSAEEKTVLTHGQMAVPIMGPMKLPADAVIGAGYVHGIPRLGVPSLRETDASLGVAWLMGLRKDGATALPSGMAMGSTWDPDLIHAGGAMIGAEAKAKGFNVMLAGGTNLIRDPRNGRTFEYLSEDPLLSGVLAGNAIAGIQSNGIISTIKHFAVNDQESGRYFLDARISESAARESDLLAFQIGLEIGRPGAVMCAYNKVNGAYACENDWLLQKVLKQDWGYKGFVMSDWGAVHGVEAAIHGLDQQSGQEMDPKVFFSDTLAGKAASDPQYARRLDDMNKRILTSIYAHGLDKPGEPAKAVDAAANLAVSRRIAEQGIVLLRNVGGVLPLAGSAKSIAVIGGFADTGVLSGAGSSQVNGEKGPALTVPIGGSGPFAAMISQQYQPGAPFDAIKRRAAGAEVRFRDSRYISRAVELARHSDIAIVFATQWMTEGIDAPDLGLPDGQDALIEAVAAANPRTIVVLETGGPVLMPWLGKTAAVVEAWYPGAAGAEAIASVLFGETNPSGRLSVTFPAATAQLPRPHLDGVELSGDISPGNIPANTRLNVNYDIEGADVGYRWNALKQQRALFPFGFGLSYTAFQAGKLQIQGNRATMLVTNTGQRSGATVVQLYLVGRAGRKVQRLVGFQRVALEPGESRSVSMTIDNRLLADWADGKWTIPAGDYDFALGENAEALGPSVRSNWKGRVWAQ